MTLPFLRRSDSTRSIERAATSDLSVRSDGRTVFGIAIPYGVDSVVDDGWGPYTERFQRGAFAKTLSENGDRVKLCVNHEKLRRLPIGKATVMREDAAGLYGEFRVSRTTAGDEALTLIRDGVVDSFSVGFVPVKERKTGPGIIERTEVALREVSVVSFPAYKGALIQGLRADLAIDDEELERLAEMVRSEPSLLTLLAERIGHPLLHPDTSAEEAVTPDSDEEPTSTAEPVEATRASDTPDEGAVAPYQPTQRPAPPTHESRKAQREDVRAMLAQLTRSA